MQRILRPCIHGDSKCAVRGDLLGKGVVSQEAGLVDASLVVQDVVDLGVEVGRIDDSGKAFDREDVLEEGECALNNLELPLIQIETVVIDSEEVIPERNDVELGPRTEAVGVLVGDENRVWGIVDGVHLELALAREGLLNNKVLVPNEIPNQMLHGLDVEEEERMVDLAKHKGYESDVI